MSVLMQGRAFSNGKVVGIDGISAEILESIPWRVSKKIREAFEIGYFGQNIEKIETWLRNIIVLNPKKNVHRQTGRSDKRNLCAECSVCWPSGVADASRSWWKWS